MGKRSPRGTKILFKLLVPEKLFSCFVSRFDASFFFLFFKLVLISGEGL